MICLLYLIHFKKKGPMESIAWLGVDQNTYSVAVAAFGMVGLPKPQIIITHVVKITLGASQIEMALRKFWPNITDAEIDHMLHLISVVRYLRERKVSV